MVQWINLQRNNRFISTMLLYISWEKSKALHLVEEGLTSGRLAG